MYRHHHENHRALIWARTAGAAMTGVITRYADAWRRSDIVEMIDCYHDDVVVHYGGTSEFAGTHHGRDRLLDVLAETAQRSGRQLVTIDDHGTHGALFVTETVIVDGAVTPVARALRYRTTDDKLAECWLYDHDQQLVDLAWSHPTGG